MSYLPFSTGNTETATTVLRSIERVDLSTSVLIPHTTVADDGGLLSKKSHFSGVSVPRNGLFTPEFVHRLISLSALRVRVARAGTNDAVDRTLKSRVAIILLVVLLLAGSTPIRVNPWAHGIHQQIAQDALQYLPSELKRLLERNRANYLDGSIAPDTQFKDFVNHVWHVDLSYGNAVNKIASEVDLIRQKVKGHLPEGDVAFEFGVLLHYVTDLNNPLHTSQKDASEDSYHSKFEDYADSLLPITYQFDGLTNVTDIRQHMIQTANWAYQYYDNISGFYASGSSGSQGKYCGSKNSDVYHYPSCHYVSQIHTENLIWFVDEYDAWSKGYRPCKVCNPPAYTGSPTGHQSGLDSIIQICYSHALNEVVDIFYTTWGIATTKSRSQVTLTASKSMVRIGEEFTLSGSVSPANAGLVVTFLQSTTGLVYTRLGSNATTTSDGRFSVRLRLDMVGTVYMKACWAGDSDYEGSESNQVAIQCLKLISSITVSVGNDSVPFNSSQMVSGTLDPHVASAEIVLTYSKSDGSRRNSTVVTSSGGGFMETIRADAVGNWNVVASWKGTDTQEGSSSESKAFQVTRMRVAVSISVLSHSMDAGESIHVSGTITPKVPLGNVCIVYLKPDGSRASRNATIDSSGNFQDSYQTDATGSWTVQALYGGDALRESSASESVVVKVNPAFPYSAVALAMAIALIAGFFLIRRRGHALPPS